MNIDPVRISVVSYLNSTPFIFGLRNFQFENQVEISEDIPAVCAEKLITKKADIGLVPVAALLDLEKYSIVSDYCIGGNGYVKSVLLLSQVPLPEIKCIFLDYQSRTSVMLARVLAKKLWKINPAWKNTQAGFENEISGTSAGVVIGDRALIIRDKFKYVYDLSFEWKRLTGLSFVFACWTSVINLDESFLNQFNTALKNGLNSIDKVSKYSARNNFSEEQIKDYLTTSIDFNFNDEKKKALQLFLSYSKEIRSAF